MHPWLAGTSRRWAERGPRGAPGQPTAAVRDRLDLRPLCRRCPRNRSQAQRAAHPHATAPAQELLVGRAGGHRLDRRGGKVDPPAGPRLVFPRSLPFLGWGDLRHVVVAGVQPRPGSRLGKTAGGPPGGCTLPPRRSRRWPPARPTSNSCQGGSARPGRAPPAPLESNSVGIGASRPQVWAITDSSSWLTKGVRLRPAGLLHFSSDPGLRVASAVWAARCAGPAGSARPGPSRPGSAAGTDARHAPPGYAASACPVKRRPTAIDCGLGRAGLIGRTAQATRPSPPGL